MTTVGKLRRTVFTELGPWETWDNYSGFANALIYSNYAGYLEEDESNNEQLMLRLVPTCNYDTAQSIYTTVKEILGACEFVTYSIGWSNYGFNVGILLREEWFVPYLQAHLFFSDLIYDRDMVVWQRHEHYHLLYSMMLGEQQAKPSIKVSDVGKCVMTAASWVGYSFDSWSKTAFFDQHPLAIDYV